MNVRLAWFQYNRDGGTHLLQVNEQKIDPDDGQIYQGGFSNISDEEAIRMADELYEYLATLRSTQLGKTVSAIALAPVEEPTDVPA